MTPDATPLRRFAAVIFDMDGLLIDSEVTARDTFLQSCQAFAIEAEVGLFLRCIGTNDAGTLAVLRQELEGRDDLDLFYADWRERYDAATAMPIPLKGGVVELLDHLGQARVPTGVATSSSNAGARKKLGLAGILDAFAVIVGGDQVTSGKPDPEIYLQAAADLKAEASACLALEDSENGVRAAVAAGMTVVQVPDLVPPSDGLRALGHHVVDSLLDVMTVDFDQIGS